MQFLITGFLKQPVDFYNRPLWLAEVGFSGVSLSLTSSLNQVKLGNVIVITALTFTSIFSAVLLIV
jgi:uncharacterized membrane protein (UPF0182 family)